jgi:hypothetical protein
VTGLLEVATTLQIRVRQLLLGGLDGLGRLADLVADLGEALADLFVGEGGDLRLELVDLVDQGLDPAELTVVRIDESGEEVPGPGSIWSGAGAPSWTAVAQERRRDATNAVA